MGTRELDFVHPPKMCRVKPSTLWWSWSSFAFLVGRPTHLNAALAGGASAGGECAQLGRCGSSFCTKRENGNEFAVDESLFKDRPT